MSNLPIKRRELLMTTGLGLAGTAGLTGLVTAQPSGWDCVQDGELQFSISGGSAPPGGEVTIQFEINNTCDEPIEWEDSDSDSVWFNITLDWEHDLELTSLVDDGGEWDEWENSPGLTWGVESMGANETQQPSMTLEVPTDIEENDIPIDLEITDWSPDVVELWALDLSADEATGTITIEEDPSGDPEFLITFLSVDETTVAPGETVSGILDVTNVGSSDGTTTVVGTLEDEDTDGTFDINANETIPLSFELDAPTTPGEYQLIIETEDDQETRLITVEGGAELELTAEGDETTPGGEATVEFTLSNTGETTADEAGVQLGGTPAFDPDSLIEVWETTVTGPPQLIEHPDSDGDFAVSDRFWRVFDLDPGESQTLTLTWEAPEDIDPGGYDIDAYELDEPDVEATGTITIEEGDPEFLITSLSVDETTVAPGESVSGALDVTNVGSSDGTTTVVGTLENEDTDGTFDIDVDETIQLSFELDAPTTPGEYQLVIETEDDQETRLITVEGGAELELTAEGDETTPGGEATVEFTLSNIGETTADEARVQLGGTPAFDTDWDLIEVWETTVTGPGQLIEHPDSDGDFAVSDRFWRVFDLDPGESQTLTLTWEVPEDIDPGEYEVDAAEWDESEVEATGTITIEENPGTVTGTVTGPDGDELTDITVQAVDWATNTVEATTTTDSTGDYEFELPANTTYELRVSDELYSSSDTEVTVVPGETHIRDLSADLTTLGQYLRDKQELADEIDAYSLTLSDADTVDSLLENLTTAVRAGNIDSTTASGAVRRHIYGELLVQDVNTGLGPGAYGEPTPYHPSGRATAEYNLRQRTVRNGIEFVVKYILISKLLLKKAAAQFGDNRIIHALLDELSGATKELTTRTLDLFFGDSPTPEGDNEDIRSQVQGLIETETDTVVDEFSPTLQDSYNQLTEQINDSVDTVAAQIANSYRAVDETKWFRPSLLALQEIINADAVADDGLPGDTEAARNHFETTAEAIDTQLDVASGAMDNLQGELFEGDDGLLDSFIELGTDPSLTAFIRYLQSKVNFVWDVIGFVRNLSNVLIGDAMRLPILLTMTAGTTGVTSGAEVSLPEWREDS